MNLIEGDGFIFNILHYLWAKDPCLGFGIQNFFFINYII